MTFIFEKRLNGHQIFFILVGEKFDGDKGDRLGDCQSSFTVLQ